MEDEADLVTRLKAAESRWSTVRGTFRTWRDQELVTRAFMDWHRPDHPGDSGQGGSGSSRFFVTAVRKDAETSSDSRVEHLLRVWAADHGRRRRAEAISRTGEQWMADLVVVDEPWFWARTLDRVETNDGNPKSTHGGADFVALLRPSGAPDGFRLTATGTTEAVAGRLCDIAVAVPRPIDPTDFTVPGSEVFGMISGGREFRLWVDQQTSALIRVTKLVAGTPAEIAEFLDIAFDEPLDQRLFQPLT